MRAELTEEDIKELKNSCKPGIVIPFLFFFIGSAIIFMFEYQIELNPKTFFTVKELFISSIIFYFFICILIGYLMIRKYVTDIRNGEKEIEVKIVMQKESKEDYEAGSGSTNSVIYTKEMNSFTNCSIIVDNTRYRVDEDFYKLVKVGDEVCFNYGPISRDLIKIEMKKMPVYGSTPINLFN